ncbi:carboxymuconolactone decarboxylase family protein [Corynebacterium epidermidicanis]|uniref:Alkylhydroperoxidase AhpD family core domain n=1 Tax=Corynebacterium epidermidicanis TaxID=1050174 RepID=A0A0G3GSW2_9CORY|nr:carboxymuconolactone decarboxylase family protein [Corynebacterium epidermidicanis]AKK04214.1 alkylhydroperoxidase AhpD family core domain [Corynebacterium epidermidicanis]
MKPNRPYLDKTDNATYKAMFQAAKMARENALAVGLDVATIELINTRCSQLNGCVTCLSLHVPAARKAGVSQQKLDVLPAWREANVFSDRERAFLQIAELATIMNPARPLDPEFDQLSSCLSTAEVAAAEWVAVVINAFNRVSILSGHPALGTREG